MPKARWTKCVPIALWPPADRAAWEAAMRPGDPFEEAGIATRWSAATRRKTACGYGRFLFWLLERGELDVTADPAARITHERLTSYLEDLRSANRGHTIHNRIQELGDAMRALAPDHEWSFIRRVAARLRADAVPARDKRGRLPPIAEIVAQGYRMMARAERPGARSELARAALYRDGLLLMFLAYHPLRLRNLSSLRIGRHLFDHRCRSARSAVAGSRARSCPFQTPQLCRRKDHHTCGRRDRCAPRRPQGHDERALPHRSSAEGLARVRRARTPRPLRRRRVLRLRCCP